jgi:hypothetical protein
MLSPVGGGGALSEAAHPNVQIKSESQSDKALGKRKAKAEPVAAEDCEDAVDGECMEVESGAPDTVKRDAQDEEDEDEDCQITGRSGSLALSDVPAALNRHY